MVKEPSDASSAPKVPPNNTPRPGEQKGAGGVHYGKGGKIEGKPMTFLGMHFTAEEAGKLWQTIVQSINSQISKDKDKAIEQMKKDWDPNKDD